MTSRGCGGKLMIQHVMSFWSDRTLVGSREPLRNVSHDNNHCSKYCHWNTLSNCCKKKSFIIKWCLKTNVCRGLERSLGGGGKFHKCCTRVWQTKVHHIYTSYRISGLDTYESSHVNQRRAFLMWWGGGGACSFSVDVFSIRWFYRPVCRDFSSVNNAVNTWDIITLFPPCPHVSK